MSCPVRGVEPRSHLGGGSAVELHRYGLCPQKIAIFVRQLQKFAIMVSEFDFLLLKTRVETLELFTRGMFNGQAKSIQQKWANLHHYLKIYHSELATLCRNLSLSPDRDRADRLRAEIDLACSVSFVRGRLQEVGETQSTYGIAHRIAKMIPYNEPYQESLLEAVRAYAAAHPDDPEVRQLFH